MFKNTSVPNNILAAPIKEEVEDHEGDFRVKIEVEDQDQENQDPSANRPVKIEYQDPSLESFPLIQDQENQRPSDAPLPGHFPLQGLPFPMILPVPNFPMAPFGMFPWFNPGCYIPSGFPFHLGYNPGNIMQSLPLLHGPPLPGFPVPQEPQVLNVPQEPEGPQDHGRLQEQAPSVPKSRQDVFCDSANSIDENQQISQKKLALEPRNVLPVIEFPDGSQNQQKLQVPPPLSKLGEEVYREAQHRYQEILDLPLRDKKTVFTKNVCLRIAAELKARNISRKTFGERICGKSHTFISDVINKPTTWNSEPDGKLAISRMEAYMQILNWLELCEKDKKAVIEGRDTECCEFKAPKRRNKRRAMEELGPKAKTPRTMSPQEPQKPNVHQEVEKPKEEPTEERPQDLQKEPEMLQKPSELEGSPNPLVPNEVEEPQESSNEHFQQILALPLRDNNTVLTENIAQRVAVELSLRNISQNAFAEKVCGRTKISHIFQKPKQSMSFHLVGSTYRQLLNWLEICEKDKMAVLKGQKTECCEFSAPKPAVFHAGKKIQKQRIVYTEQQNQLLKTAFKQNPHPNDDEMDEIAKQLGFTLAFVRKAFRNRRKSQYRKQLNS